MQSPLQVSFRGFDPSPELRELIQRSVDELERFHPKITQCRVAVTLPHRHQHKGARYQVHIQVGIPSGEVVVDRPNDVTARHEEAGIAIRDAFKLARRRVREALQRARRQVKVHEAPLIGRIIRLFPSDGYGFLQDVDGQEIYFHENGVINGSFEELEIGDRVRYVLGQGIQGLQASTVDAARALA